MNDLTQASGVAIGHETTPVLMNCRARGRGQGYEYRCTQNGRDRPLHAGLGRQIEVGGHLEIDGFRRLDLPRRLEYDARWRYGEQRSGNTVESHLHAAELGGQRSLLCC